MTGVSLSAARRLSMWLILIALVAAVAEGGSFVALRAIKHSPARFLVWDPDLTQLPKIWADAAGQWDEDLGWPAPRDATAPPRDHTGAKLNTDFPDPGTACAAAYGDSFVWGEEVAPAEGWIEQLSRLIGCRVSNYGVSGYGTDQSFVRFQPQHRRGSTGGDTRHLCRERCAQRCRLPLVPRPGAASALAQGTVPARHRGRARVVGTAETRRLLDSSRCIASRSASCRTAMRFPTRATARSAYAFPTPSRRCGSRWRRVF